MTGPKILIAPLDWGLGHATRCVPIVNELIRQGCEVCIAADGACLSLLQKEFPRISIVHLGGYNVIYHHSKYSLRWAIAKQIPRLLGGIRQENKWLKQVLKEQHFDAVISDNRFGLYNDSTRTIFITHQLYIKTGMGKWADHVLQTINHRHISRFNECWVPDFKGAANLAGELSHAKNLPNNVQYIGPLSRFEKIETSHQYDLLILLSGPEPRRTIWEKTLFNQLQTYRGKALLIRGLPDCKEKLDNINNTQIINHLQAAELNILIQQSEWVICRSGYTSVMDLVKLQHKAILVPTAGQTEQEYLAQYLQQQKMFYTVTEDRFSIKTSLEEAQQFLFNFGAFEQMETTYTQQISKLISSIPSKKK